MRCGVKVLLILTTLMVASGCATKALWEEGQFARWHEPTTPSNLDLFKPKDQNRILVLYDEETDQDNLRHRRAYWIDPSAAASVNPFRPHFVRTNAAKS